MGSVSALSGASMIGKYTFLNMKELSKVSVGGVTVGLIEASEDVTFSS
jgi:hypothetical protein